MWKSKSAIVSAKIRIRSGGPPQRCLVYNGHGLLQQQPPPPPASKPPPPPASKPPPTEVPKTSPSPRKRGVFGKLLGLTVLGVGGVIGYAWYDKKFRTALCDLVPYSRGALDAVFQYLPDSPTVPAILSKEPQFRSESSDTVMPSVLPPPLPLPEPTSATQQAVNTEKQTPPPEVIKETEQETQREAQKRREAEKRETEEKQRREAKEHKEREVEAARKRKQEKEDEVAAENTALEEKLGGLVAVCSRSLNEAITLQNHVIDATRTHTQLLRTAMDDNSQILEKDEQWQSVAMAMNTRQEAIEAAEQAVIEAKSALEHLRRAIDDGRANAVTKKNKSLTTTKDVLNNLSSEFNQKSTQVAAAEADVRVLLNCKALVDTARTQFAKELESITPEVRIGSKRGSKLTEEDLNLLLAHAHRRVSQLQQQLAKHVAMEQVRLQEALTMQQTEDNQLTEQKLAQERDRINDHLALQLGQLEAELQVEYEGQLRRQLALQAAAHSDHLQDVLLVREQEMDRQFEKRLLDRLVQERADFSLEISSWVARLKGIESAVDARAEVEKTRLQEQQMWVACIALHNAIATGTAGATWDAQLLPLAAKVAAVLEAAISHPLVDVVVESIPQEALQRGVYTEQNLRDRFLRVNKVARRVAWIDSSGGSLMQYLASYMKSIVRYPLTFRLTRSLDDEMSVDGEGAVGDNFELLVAARYWLEHGDLQQVVRLLSQLRGESRHVAADWLHEARLHLEAKQAAHTLLAFAAASGLGSIG